MAFPREHPLVAACDIRTARPPFEGETKHRRGEDSQDRIRGCATKQHVLPSIHFPSCVGSLSGNDELCCYREEERRTGHQHPETDDDIPANEQRLTASDHQRMAIFIEKQNTKNNSSNNGHTKTHICDPLAVLLADDKVHLFTLLVLLPVVGAPFVARPEHPLRPGGWVSCFVGKTKQNQKRKPFI